MTHFARIAKRLSDRVTEYVKSDRGRSRASSLDEEIVCFLLEVIKSLPKCTSYKTESETIPDHDNEDASSDFEDKRINSKFD